MGILTDGKLHNNVLKCGGSCKATVQELPAGKIDCELAHSRGSRLLSFRCAAACFRLVLCSMPLAAVDQ